MTTNGKYGNIKDPELREALDFISKVQSEGKRKFTMDLHSGNIMWRITGNRPQLVIMDPLA
jgi:hypothetical protein